MAQPSHGKGYGCGNACVPRSLQWGQKSVGNWSDGMQITQHYKGIFALDVVVAVMMSLRCEKKARFGGVRKVLNFNVNSSQMNCLNNTSFFFFFCLGCLIYLACLLGRQIRQCQDLSLFCKSRSVIPSPGYSKRGTDVAELFGITSFSYGGWIPATVSTWLQEGLFFHWQTRSRIKGRKW